MIEAEWKCNKYRPNSLHRANIIERLDDKIWVEIREKEKEKLDREEVENCCEWIDFQIHPKCLIAVPVQKHCERMEYNIQIDHLIIIIKMKIILIKI